MALQSRMFFHFFAKKTDIFKSFMSQPGSTPKNYVYDCSYHFTTTMKNLVLELDFNVFIFRFLFILIGEINSGRLAPRDIKIEVVWYLKKMIGYLD